MAEPEKPFACSIPDCGMTFTNEDHLNVHTKKHDMMLQFGPEQKAAFVAPRISLACSGAVKISFNDVSAAMTGTHSILIIAGSSIAYKRCAIKKQTHKPKVKPDGPGNLKLLADQTPTPTRFIRNCEEVGLFQDLQNVNPFDEGFKRAMETKHGILSLENVIAVSDDLHTPQMVYPLIDSGDSTLYSTTNNQRNITISRSSSDESGAIKEFETTTISKLTNEVTTISRIVGKHDDNQKNEELHTKDAIRKDSVSYTNNVIKIHSNVEIRKDNVEKNPLQTLISYEDTTIKDSIVTKDVLLTDCSKTHLPDVPPIMSQKSIDRVVDSLTADFNREDYSKRNKKEEDYEVIIKLPNGKKVRMKAVEEGERMNAKEKLKKALTEKAESKPFQRLHSVTNATILPNLVPITTGTLIPVTILNQNQLMQKIPIQPLPVKLNKSKKPIKRKKSDTRTSDVSKCDVNSEKCSSVSESAEFKKTSQDLDSKSAASRRYRARLKETWSQQNEEIRQLRETNERLMAEKAVLKMLVTEHMKHCPNADDLRNIQEKLNNAGANI